MKEEKLTDKILYEILNLLNSEDSHKQKLGFQSLRLEAAIGSSVGNMEAVYYEGICYKKELGTRQSDENAFYCFQRAAEKIPEAMYELGVCYIHEIGTEQDVAKAFCLFQ